MSPDSTLLDLERAFMRALREPVFGRSRELTPLSRRKGDVSDGFRRTAERYIQPSTSLKPVDRLELYHRQYWFRLLDSIAEDFPTLRRLLGEEVFWNLVEAYLESIPSRSYTLRHLGSQMAAFVIQHPALAGAYPRHAFELTRLENAVCEAFEAADEPVIEPDQLAETPLTLQPHVKLFAFTTPADALWRLAAEEPAPETLFHAPKLEPAFHVAVFRENDRTRVERMPREAFQLLRAIQTTGELEAALESSGLCETVAPDQADQIREWFGLWTARGWFCPRQTQSIRIPVRVLDGLTQTQRIPIHNQPLAGRTKP